MKCHVCGDVLTPVFHPGEYDEQLTDALWVTLEGGYGMFFDTDFTTSPDTYRVVLCHSCAHDLCNKNEWIAKLIQPEHMLHFADSREYQYHDDDEGGE